MAQELEPILVVDGESTCGDGSPTEGEESEIIEIEWCVVDVNTLQRSSKHRILCRLLSESRKIGE